MTIYLSSGGAEVIAILLVPLLGAVLGSAVTAALTAALTTIAVLSLLHGLGLGVALGSHRLDRRGHWLLRPLLFSAGFAVLSLGSVSSNAVLFVSLLDNEEVTWWVVVAPLSAALVQVAAGVVVALWAIDRVARLLGDYLTQVGLGDGERASVWWRRTKIAARWFGAGLWVLAALGLIGGSLLGAVVTIPLFAVAGHGSFAALYVHGVLMLVGLAAGGVLLVTRVAAMRSKGRESSRNWSAKIHGKERESVPGKAWRVLVSLVGWLLGEIGLWFSGTCAVFFALSVWVSIATPDQAEALLFLAAPAIPLALGGMYLTRAGGPLRALLPDPGSDGLAPATPPKS